MRRPVHDRFPNQEEENSGKLKRKQKGKNQRKIMNNISEKDCFALNRKMIYHSACAPERFMGVSGFRSIKSKLLQNFVGKQCS